MATRGAPTVRRVRLRVEGTVQGVGFRPYVYRLAGDLGLAGWVMNDEHGVLAEVEGEVAAVERFLARLPEDTPPLATVEDILTEDVSPSGADTFEILRSAERGEPDAWAAASRPLVLSEAAVSPDVATCADCLAELLDPTDRRYRYPFVNCTNCGPRFTIVRGVPYDRPLTTMADFEMCPACRAEYDDPRNRRFHAQPNACPACGPAVRLFDRRGRPVSVLDPPSATNGAAAGGSATAEPDTATAAEPDTAPPAKPDTAPTAADPLATAAAALDGGAIVAVKGLGGYHLACRADDERAVALLRARKRREDRPFALMAGDLTIAQMLVELTPPEQQLLLGRERPIVIARRHPNAPVAPSVAPRSADLGVMLPYSPLHHLLLADCETTTLVMTSGNVSDEPIAYEDGEALARLGGIADLLLTHDRPIHMRTDDSVVRAVASRRPLVLRRSRGWVPGSVDLPLTARRPLLACGAELKSTFCVAKGRRAWVGHHIGDLRNWETLRSFREGVEHFERVFAVEPAVVAHDLHPDYLSTVYALEREGVEHVGVQHHHAHLAACLAEHGERGPAVGAIFDGAGHGGDGTVWGGELLVGGLDGFERAGSLWPVRLPGGDRAAREPWRMACAWLSAVSESSPPPPPPHLLADVSPERWEQVGRLCITGLASPLTTSAGRLFDAVAALCGLRAMATYEGQAAAELEGVADVADAGAYPLPLVESGGLLLLDARATVTAVLADLDAGASPALVSARFHTALATATAAACERLAERAGLSAVVLSGGVFQNRLLLERTAEQLERSALRVLVPERLPPNDGGISYGQAAIAAARDGAL
jgi:hydrogenase maturation protein HypF